MKINLVDSVDKTKELWDKVVDQVKGKGLALGVYAAPPEFTRTGGRPG